MAEKNYAWQSLLAIVVMTAILLGAVYWIAGDAFKSAGDFYILIGVGLIVAIVLWLLIRRLGSQLADGVRAEPALTQQKVTASARQEAPATPVQPVAQKTPPPVADDQAAIAGAVQMLTILQRQGRLVDFLQEDLSNFQDAQIGAAVRSVHAGCRQALVEHMRLEPILDGVEGGQVTIEPGFDAYAIRLSGNVSGEPPFSGTLQHRGWRAVQVDLPKRIGAGGDELIVASAQVEVA